MKSEKTIRCLQLAPQDDDEDSYSVLRCPRCECGGDPYWLHQSEVTVWDRPREDAESGIRATINSEGVHMGTSMVGNPSSRRDGLSIAFFCEWCGEDLTLCIVQHKGQTLVHWEFGEATT